MFFNGINFCHVQGIYIYIHEVIHIFQIDVFMLGMLNPKYNMPKRKHMNLENIYITLCTCIYIVHVFQNMCVDLFQLKWI